MRTLFEYETVGHPFMRSAFISKSKLYYSNVSTIIVSILLIMEKGLVSKETACAAGLVGSRIGCLILSTEWIIIGKLAIIERLEC